MPPPPARARHRVRRLPERALYDAGAVAAVLDAGFVCHVGVVREGAPVVVPTLYARDDDRLLLHGSTKAGIFRDVRMDPAVCVTVTHVDGLVLARSAFHHSVNYRSVVVHGAAHELVDPAEKARALQVITEHLVPGRWAHVRPPNEEELAQTAVFALSLREASVKVRTGPPKDDAEDLEAGTWGGVLPLSLVAGEPVPDGHVAARTPVPAHVSGWRAQPD